MKIDEIDVWHMGDDAEIDALLASAKGKPLDGHTDMVCIGGAIEEAHPIPGLPPEPREATPAEMAGGVIAMPPADGGKWMQGVGGKWFYHGPIPMFPGRKRLRLNYRAS
jgi:hypothetical protein